MTIASAERLVSRTPKGPGIDLPQHAAGHRRRRWLGDDTNVVVVIGPEHRRFFIEAGWSKADLRAAMWPLLMAPQQPGEGRVKLGQARGPPLVAAGGPGMAETW